MPGWRSDLDEENRYCGAGDARRNRNRLRRPASVMEWAYDRDTHIGRLDKALDKAAGNGWTVVDMKADWRVVHPFELE